MQTRPSYAILSHTWLCDGEEVTFEDLLEYHAAVARGESSLAASFTTRKGFQKIQGCCNIAVQSKLEWAWIDTCCIDKRSSAELSEAINSMFKWYRSSKICLGDDTSFQDSRWFTRGWTLQELLAPKRLSFYDHKWQLIGAMNKDPNLCETISDITSIPVAFLQGSPLTDACVAKRMSWASKRHTTRPEDIAYSLLGIFDVNMPLLYGEGHKAFTRLQEAIISQTYDHSILAWGIRNPKPLYERDVSSKPEALGVLAMSPKDFEDCGDFETDKSFFHGHTNLEFDVTPAGIRLSANILDNYHDGEGYSLCELSCYTWSYPSRRIMIQLRPGPLGRDTTAKAGWPQYVRNGRDLWCHSDPPLALFGPRWHRDRTITIAKDIAMSAIKRRHQASSCSMILLNIPKNHICSVEYVHPGLGILTNPHQVGKNSLRIYRYPGFSTARPSNNPFHYVFKLVLFVTPAAAVFGIYHLIPIAFEDLCWLLIILELLFISELPLAITRLRWVWIFILGKGAEARLDRDTVGACIAN
ncbi:hypothetical protein RRF57_010389 [Xylaria bambusicola]|uniref:Heterokaryon incompatibility domain-containing protein n=1 Tax=Xylaria bambusicola TaxID=326684 RepID=A0AAN7UY44_9PEZI